ncbi:MAG: DNA adenine methylase [Bacteroidia bacterium]
MLLPTGSTRKNTARTSSIIGRTLSNKREAFTKEYAKRLEQVQIECKDALKVIEQYDGKDTFFYLDPPYFNSDCGHYKGYTEQDYEKLLQALEKIQGKFLLSSYPSELLNTYVTKNNWRKQEKEQTILLSHQTKKKKTEVMVYSYDALQQKIHTRKQKQGLRIKYSAIKCLHKQKKVSWFASMKNIYDARGQAFQPTPSDKAVFKKLHASMNNGIRSAKSTTAKKWLQNKSLSIEKSGAVFNSGQIHHRKTKEFIEELKSIGFLIASTAATNTGETGYCCFGKNAILFPLRNKENEVLNFYAIGITKDKQEYLNSLGLYPNYPHPQCKRLYLTETILDAATLLESNVMDNKEAVLALHNGEMSKEHIEAIEGLNDLEEIILIEKCGSATDLQIKN